jgi:hypothetical protein
MIQPRLINILYLEIILHSSAIGPSFSPLRNHNIDQRKLMQEGKNELIPAKKIKVSHKILHWDHPSPPSLITSTTTTNVITKQTRKSSCTKEEMS